MQEMNILAMEAKKNNVFKNPISKSNHPLLYNKVKVHMYLHAVIMTMDQNFLWSTLVVNHFISFLLRNHISCSMQSPKVRLSGL